MRRRNAIRQWFRKVPFVAKPVHTHEIHFLLCQSTVTAEILVVAVAMINTFMHFAAAELDSMLSKG